MSVRQFYNTWISPQRWLERAGVRPPMQIVIGLVLLTSCVLMFSQAFQLVPTDQEADLRLRMLLVQMASSRIATELASGENSAARTFMQQLLSDGHDILSVGVRRLDGTTILETAEHAKYWKGAESAANTPTHVEVLLYNGKTPWANLQIVFKPLPTPPLWQAWRSAHDARLSFFILGSCFVLFWLFLSRMLRTLDPSAAVPERMQRMMDTLVEGIAILDNDDRIVMVNQSFARTAFMSMDRLIGQPLSKLPWLAHDGSPPPQVYAWQTVKQDNLPQRGVPLRLQIGARHTRSLNVNASPIMDSNGTRRGVLVTFDDQTVVESDNAELAQLLARFSEASDGIHEFREQIRSLGDYGYLSKLEELANSARELAAASKTHLEETSAASKNASIDQSPINAEKAVISAPTALNSDHQRSDVN
jgi:PAS domain S-box-containing protein